MPAPWYVTESTAAMTTELILRYLRLATRLKFTGTISLVFDKGTVIDIQETKRVDPASNSVLKALID